jgi:uncharacterized protein
VPTVLELWRYPVKSMLGERLEEVRIDTRGVVGDRLFAVADREGKLGSGKSSRRFRTLPGLFELRARSNGDHPIVTLPDGRELPVGDPALDAFLSERYADELHVTRESTVPHHDAAPLHLVTTASLRWLQSRLPESAIDRRRFRPNMVIDVEGDEPVEDEWVGSRFVLGDAMITIRERCVRCVMTTNAQDDLPKDSAVLREVTAANDACLGVVAEVERAGTVRLGDEVRVLRVTDRRELDPRATPP